MLPAGRALPRPSCLEFELLPPIAPGDAEFTDSRTLAHAARRRILGALDNAERSESEQNIASQGKKRESTPNPC